MGLIESWNLLFGDGGGGGEDKMVAEGEWCLNMIDGIVWDFIHL